MLLLWSIIRLALKNLRSNKLRSTLTMLGMIIGVSSVITMVAIGRGAERTLLAEIRKFVSPRTIYISATYRGNSAVRNSFTIEDCQAMMHRVPGVDALTPDIETSVQVRRGNKTIRTRLNGVSNAFTAIGNIEIQAGRWFLAGEERRARKVAIVGFKIVEELFHSIPLAALGEQIKLNREVYLIVGVLKEQGTSLGMNRDDLILVPYVTAMTRITGKRNFEAVQLLAKSENQVTSVAKDLTELVRWRHKIKPWDEDDFRVQVATEGIASIKQAVRMFTALVSSIAALSLLVGGIGIMNIMLVTVTERTREIGIRKALGARRGDIMRQFLVEALVLSFTGGIIGILLGSGAAYGLNIAAIKAFKLTQSPGTNVSLFSVSLAFSICFVVGIFFGLYPARKASLLDPIEALRHE